MSENAMTRTCPICESETEEIDQGTFDGTASVAKHMERLKLSTTPCTKPTWPALSSGSVRSRSPGPEPPLQVAVPQCFQRTLIRPANADFLRTTCTVGISHGAWCRRARAEHSFMSCWLAFTHP
jgi:hypothetical protein